MSDRIIQCCYTNENGWKTVAQQGDADRSLIGELSRHSTMPNKVTDKNGNMLNLLEIVGNGNRFYVMRTQYGLVDAFGRSNMFSHAYSIDIDSAIFDPNEFLTVADSNFCDNRSDAEAEKHQIDRTERFSLSSAMKDAGLTRQTYSKLIKCVYQTSFRSVNKSTLAVHCDGSIKQIRALMYCIYIGIMPEIAKKLSMVSDIYNFSDMRNVVFCTDAAKQRKYFIPETGENNVLSENVDKNISALEFVDYAVLNLDNESVFSEYFIGLEFKTAELGNGKEINDELRRIAHLMVVTPEPISSGSEKTPDEFLISTMEYLKKSAYFSVDAVKSYYGLLEVEAKNRGLIKKAVPKAEPPAAIRAENDLSANSGDIPITHSHPVAAVEVPSYDKYKPANGSVKVPPQGRQDRVDVGISRSAHVPVRSDSMTTIKINKICSDLRKFSSSNEKDKNTVDRSFEELFAIAKTLNNVSESEEFGKLRNRAVESVLTYLSYLSKADIKNLTSKDNQLQWIGLWTMVSKCCKKIFSTMYFGEDSSELIRKYMTIVHYYAWRCFTWDDLIDSSGQIEFIENLAIYSTDIDLIRKFVCVDPDYKINQLIAKCQLLIKLCSVAKRDISVGGTGLCEWMTSLNEYVFDFVNEYGKLDIGTVSILKTVLITAVKSQPQKKRSDKEKSKTDCFKLMCEHMIIAAINCSPEEFMIYIDIYKLLNIDDYRNAENQLDMFDVANKKLSRTSTVRLIASMLLQKNNIDVDFIIRLGEFFENDDPFFFFFEDLKKGDKKNNSNEEFVRVNEYLTDLGASEIYALSQKLKTEKYQVKLKQSADENDSSKLVRNIVKIMDKNSSEKKSFWKR